GSSSPRTRRPSRPAADSAVPAARSVPTLSWRPPPRIVRTARLFTPVGIALVELGPQQRAEIGAARGARRVLGPELLHRIGLVGHVLRLHRQVDPGVLAGDGYDHGRSP